MARNEEKNQSMLNRYLTMKRTEEGRVEQKRRRPRLVAKVTSLSECQQFRLDLIREIADSVAVIQNTTLPDDRVRALNDEINKLIREKGRWERHIRGLGGPDFARQAARIRDADGSEVIGSGGYQYFGAAKNLPGVRELLQQQQTRGAPEGGTAGEGAPAVKRTRHELSRNVDAEYYGYGFDDDGQLAALERRVEQELLTQAQQKWDAQHSGVDGDQGEGDAGDGVAMAAAAAAEAERVASAANEAAAAAATPEAAAAALLAKRKEALLKRIPAANLILSANAPAKE